MTKKTGTPSVAQARERAMRKASAYDNFFKTLDGQEVLKDLEDKFERRTSVVAGDPYATHVKEGERGVILYIKDLITIGEKINEISEPA
jgi:hypothetical protein